MSLQQTINTFYSKLLSDKVKRNSEKVILTVAIAGFLVHLLLIYLVEFKLLLFDTTPELLTSPIVAVYTPFSFILVYEVYLLVYYLPRSITTYIRKQYEIISLIIIRRLFKDLASLKLTSDWFEIQYDLQFTYDIVASMLLFFLVYVFHLESQKRFGNEKEDERMSEGINRFINFKKGLAVLLVPLLAGIAAYTFFNWAISSLNPGTQPDVSFKNINNIFFDEFFTILIIIDVVLLLLSFFYTDKFHKVIRNSGFIISTILIRISFSVEGLINTLLIIAAIAFGVIILIVHNKFEKNILSEEENFI